MSRAADLGGKNHYGLLHKCIASNVRNPGQESDVTSVGVISRSMLSKWLPGWGPSNTHIFVYRSAPVYSVGTSRGKQEAAKH